jgi:cardiolipin synthase
MESVSSQLLITYLFMVIAGIFVFLAVTHILYQKRSPSSMTSWLISVFFIPYIAVPLYFLVGIRKRKKKKKKTKSYVTFEKNRVTLPKISDGVQQSTNELLRKNGIPPATDQNDYRLITSDTHAYEILCSEIEAAKHSIEICTYLFEKDKTTAVLLEKLTQKALEGIKVRILLDIVGSFGVYINQKPFAALKAAGGDVAFFVPFLAKPFQGYVNLRNHRKVYLFDREVVLSGGMNLSNAYLGEDDGSKRWEDIIYRLEGVSVKYFYELFVNDWMFATDQQIKEKIVIPNHCGNDTIQVVPSGPDIQSDALFEALLDAIYGAKERIWIVTPYFIPDENIKEALIIAYHKGVDVKLITPKESDHLIADLARSSYMRELFEVGIELVLYEGEMLHAKSMLFDNSIGIIGSVNLDNRSLFLNYEVVTFVYSKVQIVQIERWMSKLMDNATIGMDVPTKGREALENIMKVLAPVL